MPFLQLATDPHPNPRAALGPPVASPSSACLAFPADGHGHRVCLLCSSWLCGPTLWIGRLLVEISMWSFAYVLIQRFLLKKGVLYYRESSAALGNLVVLKSAAAIYAASIKRMANKVSTSII